MPPARECLRFSKKSKKENRGSFFLGEIKEIKQMRLRKPLRKTLSNHAFGKNFKKVAYTLVYVIFFLYFCSRFL